MLSSCSRYSRSYCDLENLEYDSIKLYLESGGCRRTHSKQYLFNGIMNLDNCHHLSIYKLIHLLIIILFVCFSMRHQDMMMHHGHMHGHATPPSQIPFPHPHPPHPHQPPLPTPQQPTVYSRPEVTHPPIHHMVSKRCSNFLIHACMIQIKQTS